MPLFSAFTPFGQYAFSSAPSLVEQFYDLLPQLWGPQHDMTQVGTYEEARRYADARMLALTVVELQHAGNQANPNTAYDLLPLLENDFLVSPGQYDSVPTRQNAVAAAMLLPGGASAGNVVNALRKTVGRSSFLAYVPSPAGLNPTVVPASPGNGPGAFKDVRIPAKFLKLVDPVATIGSNWCAYQALDPTTLPTITWSQGSSFSVGQSVLPTLAGACGFFFVCTTAGSTGTTEPAWPTVAGSTVVDGTVTWTCTSTVAQSLVAGDVIVLEPGNTNRMEKLTVTAVANTPPAGSNTTPGAGYLYFRATFTKAHDVGAPMTTGQVPYWWSTQRLNFVVLPLISAYDQATRAKIDRLMAKILRGVDTWAILGAIDSTPSQVFVGPLSAGLGMGTTPVGSFTFLVSN